ncbi:MAG: type II secretion system GspH family protein [Candidatus Omnitrophica bacterium]|nr:type II secretion system GspH family protein [Candidatus Omnitrophota bacterium]
MKIGKTGFTLIELLVVIAIISMLAGQILPSLSTAREKGRQANCINNLHQIGLAIEMYYQDYDDYPIWLSNLCKSETVGLGSNYLGKGKIFICLTDLNRGNRGHGNLSFPEINDIPLSKVQIFYSYTPSAFDTIGYSYRNPDIENCSYSYEFAPTRSNWFESTHTPEEIQQADTNGDGIVTWREAKIWQSLHGYGGQVPIVRCFWHNYNFKQKVLNLAFRDYNVYISDMEWESSSY